MRKATCTGEWPSLCVRSIYCLAALGSNSSMDLMLVLCTAVSFPVSDLIVSPRGISSVRGVRYLGVNCLENQTKSCLSHLQGTNASVAAGWGGGRRWSCFFLMRPAQKGANILGEPHRTLKSCFTCVQISLRRSCEISCSKAGGRCCAVPGVQALWYVQMDLEVEI